MKKVSWLLLMFFCAVVQAKSFYLIRHAEKVDDGSKDPVLTLQGQQRALNIAHMLSEAAITQVYATDYQRTQLTAKPLADHLGLPVTIYDPRELTAFADQLKAQEGNVLIVGHSNTTPMLVHLLSGEPAFKMSEAEYDNIYQLVIEAGQITLTQFKSLPMQSGGNQSTIQK